MRHTGILREVVRIMRQRYRQGVSLIFVLDCGHKVRKPASAGERKRVHCLECWRRVDERYR